MHKSALPKHLVKWKDVMIVKGTPADGPDMLPTLINWDSGSTLLSQIARMPIGRPIKFDYAIELVEEKWASAIRAGRTGKLPGEAGWYTLHFVEYISSLGFQIELSGDEFEVFPKNEIAA